MRFSPLSIAGAYEVELEPIEDERGYFARAFSADEFRAHGIEISVVQCNVSLTAKQGTLRGLHYQRDPYGEAKLIRCTRGSIFDVGVDLRPDSATFKSWVGLRLDTRERMAFLPVGVAHGFLTLEDDVEVTYLMSHHYVPDAATGVRFDDPAFGIELPGDVEVVSERDRSFPDFRF